ncbi:MAG: M48 family metallopeptidase [Bryobacteraceae bacterium]|nr:M48 family metallopeptidase [Bryobacteraceae bacterium]
MHSALQSVPFFETPEQICARVFRDVKPKTPVPGFRVEYCAFANANSFIRLGNGSVEVRITDLLRDAPAPVLESLACILLSKLYRKPVPPACTSHYRAYLNRKDVRTNLQKLRRERGRKLLRPPQGHVWNLVEVFDDLNLRFFGGLMARPDLGWSLRKSRTTLGHYDPCHHAIVLSSVMDRPEVPKVAVEYVMFHEMLHLRYPVEHRGARRCVHTPEFKAAERTFPQMEEARELLRRL